MTLRAYIVLALAVPLSAFGQTPIPGFSLERLSPDPAHLNSLVVSSGDGLPRGTLGLSLMLHYQQDPLVYFKDGERVGSLVASRLTAHLGAAYALMNWLELGVALPLVLMQAGDDLSAHGIAPASVAVVGSPLLQGRITILREAEGSPSDLGFTMGVTIPMGGSQGLAQDPGAGLSLIPRVGAGKSLARWLRVGAEVGAVIRGQTTLTPFAEQITDQVGSMLSFAATAATLGTRLRGELNARVLVPLSQTSSAFEVLAGVRYALPGRPFELFALAGPGFGQMPGTPRFRFLGGVAWTPFQPTQTEAAK